MLKKNKGLIITFILTVCSTLFIFYLNGIFDNTIFISDLNAEYRPLLTQLTRILHQEAGLYNFNTTLGDSFLGTLYYYLTSPFNLLCLFIKDLNILVITMVTLKLSCAGIFSYLFFKKQFKEEKTTYLIIFSLLYALSSFSLSYYFHIMWLDVYLLFPLLLLGIDKIILDNKYLLYCIVMLLTIFSNYYLSYMIIIFSFIYYNYKLLINKRSILKNNLHFFILNFLIILSSSIIFLPIFSEISSYSRQNISLFGGEQLHFNLNIINYIKTLILGNFTNIELLNEDSYYLYTSILIIPLLYFYFMNKQITRREKILSLAVIIILVLSITCNYIDYLWNAFVPTSFFNGRYTFMFILFILLLSLKALYYIDNIKLKHYLIILLNFLFIIIFIKLNTFDILKIAILLVSLILFKYSSKHQIIAILLLILIIYEVNINGYLYLNRYNFNEETNYEIFEGIDYIKKHDNNIFYRIEDNDTNSSNYSLLYNYYSIDYFMSTVKKDLVNFFIATDSIDHSYTKNTISYDGSQLILSSLLGVKYYIETQNLKNNYYKKLYQYSDNSYVYLNPYALNLGYMVNTNLLKYKLNNNGLNNLNNILKKMSNNEDILTPIKLNKIDDYNYTFENKKNKDLYILVKFKGWNYYENLKVYLNNDLLNNSNNTYVYYVKNNYAKENINLNISLNESNLNDIEGIYVYYFDFDKFTDIINNLKKEQLIVTKVKNNSLKAKIKVLNNNLLFTSIPYNNDIEVIVDGKKQDKFKVLNTFIGLKLDKGYHEIEFRYHPKILYLSIIPSILGITLLLFYLKKKRL